MKTIKGPALFLAQFAGDAAPFNSWKSITKWAADTGYKGVQVPSWDSRLIDLKKAAAAAGEKSLSLVPAAQLEELTGYVRGGCTAVGMKKAFPTLIDECATLYERVGISGGRRGVSLVVDPQELAALVGATFADIVRAG